jgi:hypothetical protein
MNATLPPRTITRPKGFGKKSNNYFTLHSKVNDIFSTKIDACEKTTIIGFKNKSDAIFVGKMIETHFRQNWEWPDTRNGDTLMLPKSSIDKLQYVFLYQWDFEDLKVTATSNILDLISVNGVIENDQGYKFSGHLYKFEAPIEFYQERFEHFIV